MTYNEIIKALECSPLNDIGGCRKIDALNLIKRQRAKIAVFSLKNANSKICVEDLKAEIEKLNVELVGMRGACESYKMHYDNAQAEVERLKEENLKLFHKMHLIQAEAIKEVAEKLPELIPNINGETTMEAVERAIKHLVKEMVGDAK